jgi:hypothetical protein
MKNFFKNLFKKKLKVSFVKGKEVAYAEVDGLFEYKGEIFYRQLSRAGRSVRKGESFSDFVHNNVDEYYNATSKEISEIRVIPLICE